MPKRVLWCSGNVTHSHPPSFLPLSERLHKKKRILTRKRFDASAVRVSHLPGFETGFVTSLLSSGSSQLTQIFFLLQRDFLSFTLLWCETLHKRGYWRD